MDGIKKIRCTATSDMVRDQEYATTLLANQAIMNDGNDCGMFNCSHVDGSLPTNKLTVLVEEKITGRVHAGTKSALQQSPRSRKLRLSLTRIREMYQDTTMDRKDGIAQSQRVSHCWKKGGHEIGLFDEELVGISIR
jgi:hypothetical protein